MSRRRDFGTIIERKGSSRFYVRFFAGRGRDRRRYERPAGPTRELAKAKLRRVQTLLAEGRHVRHVLQEVFGDRPTDAVTFADAVEPYLELVGRRRKPSTVKGYRQLLAVLRKAAWAGRDLRTIGHAEITQWLDGKERAGLSSQTLNNYLVAASGLFRWARERGLVEANPCRQVRWRPQGPGRETYLSAAEARALVRAATATFRPLLICALSTGMRRGEILTLRWREVDLEKGTVSVAAEESKTHRRRTIPMTPALQAELARLAVSRPARERRPASLVFARADGQPLSPSTVASWLEAAADACPEIVPEKKPKVTMHTLRHTAASLMVGAGVPIFDVAKILGHQDVKTTMRYAHFAPEAGRAAIGTLGKTLDLGLDDPGQGDAVHDAEVGYRIG